MSSRKRRAEPVASRADESEEESSDQGPSTARRQRRRREESSDSEAEEDGTYAGNASAAAEENGDANGDANETTQGFGEDSNKNQMIKKMVRLAIACEYARMPIRRADVGLKVLGQHGRSFKPVFEGAQIHLRKVFGMEMVELPLKEKVTVNQRRAAQKQDKTSTGTKSWIVVSILPDAYRTNPVIIPPPKAPSTQTESEYVGLYTFIISLISLSGGSLAEAKLDRYLRRTNADHYTPLDKTERLLQRMCKEGYLVRLKDVGGGGEEIVEYMVGPRGKQEVGSDGVTGLVQSVYGANTSTADGEGGDSEAAQQLLAKIQRSLRLDEEERKKQKQSQRATQQTQRRGRPRAQEANGDNLTNDSGSEESD